MPPESGLSCRADNRPEPGGINQMLKYKKAYKAWKKVSYRNHWFFRMALMFLMIMALIYLASLWYEKELKAPIISPVPEVGAVDNNYKVKFLTLMEAKEIVRQSIPNMVEMTAERFTGSAKQKNYIIYQLYCLLREESNFGENESCGDSGKSCGVLQFREATYNRIRKEMIKKGLVNELGDRFSPFYSIETTAYALVRGYGKEWGPISRGECK